ncbi:MAG: tripartite tricarboxylate transporter TctB family protein, partial [Desulfobacterales bacterium]
VYLTLISLIGYLFASVCFYFAFSRYLDKKGFGVRAVAISITSSALVVSALYFVFHYFLQVPLPAGVFF